MNVICSRNSGCCSRKMSNAGEPAQHVLRQVGAVDAQDQVLAPAAQQLALELVHARGRCGDCARTPRQSIGSG